MTRDKRNLQGVSKKHRRKFVLLLFKTGAKGSLKKKTKEDTYIFREQIFFSLFFFYKQQKYVRKRIKEEAPVASWTLQAGKGEFSIRFLTFLRFNIVEKKIQAIRFILVKAKKSA